MTTLSIEPRPQTKPELLLAAFTPSIMSAETLEAIFVRREPLAAHLLENLRTSAQTRSKRHALLVGPRGIGKTHLISLIYHRIRRDETLHGRLRIAWLREESWEVASFLDLLESILAALATEYADAELNAARAKLRMLPANVAETSAERLLLDFLGDKVLLLILENLDDLFDALDEIGQRQLRAFLQNHVNTVLLATTPSLFHGVSDHDAPFYGFFHVTHLDELTLDDAVCLLEKVADLRADAELAAFLHSETGHDRLEAVQHLAGGHPRIWIFFAGIITTEALDELVPIFMQMLDDLTPYYQSQMKQLSPQQRKIVSFLCKRRGAVSVKEIAEECRLSQQATAAQLHSLREKAFVRTELLGRESWYELCEPLMRLVFEIKESRGRPIRLIVDFMRRWYSRSERRLIYASSSPEARITRQYIKAALELRDTTDLEPYGRPVLLHRSEYIQLERTRQFQKELDKVEEAIEQAGRASTAEQWAYRGLCLCGLKRCTEALESCDKAIKITPNSPYAHNWRGNALQDLKRYEEALVSFEKAIELDPADVFAHYNRGCLLSDMKRYEEALTSFDQAMELGDEDARSARNRIARLLQYADLMANLQQAFPMLPLGETERPSYTKTFFRLILRRAEAHKEWPACVTDLISRMADRDALNWLGQELTASLSGLFADSISIETADAWNAAWQTAGKLHSELEIPLRLLDAAVQYRKKPDRRILLRLPVEERRVLEAILPMK